MIKEGALNWHDLDYYEESIRYCIDNKHNVLGLKLVTIALEQHPYSLKIKTFKVRLLLNLKDYKKAFKLLETILKEQPYEIESLLLKVRIGLKLKDVDKKELINTLKQVLILEPSYITLNLQIAYLYENIGAYEEALIHYPLVGLEDINYDFVDSYVEACLKVGDDHVDDWITFFDYMTNQHTTNASLWYHYAIGHSHSEIKSFDLALDYLDYAEALGGGEDLNIDYKRALIYFDQNLYTQSIPYFELALDFTNLHKKDKEHLYLFLGLSHESIKDRKKAFIYYEKAYAINDLSSAAIFGMVRYLKINDIKLAYEVLRKILEKEPDNGNYWYEMAHIEDIMDNLQGVEKAFQKSKVENVAKVELWLNWANAYADRDYYQKAADIIIEGLDYLPDDANLNYMAAVYLLKIKEYKMSYDYLQFALLLDFDSHHQILYHFRDSLEIQKRLAIIINEYKDTL